MKLFPRPPPIRDIGWLCTPSWRFGVSSNTVGGFGMLEDLLASYEASGGSKLEQEEIKLENVMTTMQGKGRDCAHH